MIFYYTTSSISWRAIIRNIRLQESEDKCENILGVIFQRDLKWNKQVLAVCAKLKQRLGGLSKIRHVANTRTKKLVADGIFTSILTFCIPVWGGMDQNSLRRLQILQNTAAQHVLNLPRRSNRNMMFDKLEWLSVKQLEFFHTVMTIYKMKQFNEPEYFVDKIQNVNRNGNIILNNCRLSLFRKSFSFRGLEYWNSLPSELRSISGISNFKKELKNWVMLNVQRFHDN